MKKLRAMRQRKKKKKTKLLEQHLYSSQQNGSELLMQSHSNNIDPNKMLEIANFECNLSGDGKVLQVLENEQKESSYKEASCKSDF